MQQWYLNEIPKQNAAWRKTKEKKSYWKTCLIDKVTKMAMVFMSGLQIASEFSPSVWIEPKSLACFPNRILCWCPHENGHNSEREKKREKEIRARMERRWEPGTSSRALCELGRQGGEGGWWLWGRWSDPSGKNNHKDQAPKGSPAAIRRPYTSC